MLKILRERDGRRPAERGAIAPKLTSFYLLDQNQDESSLPLHLARLNNSSELALPKTQILPFWILASLYPPEGISAISWNKNYFLDEISAILLVGTERVIDNLARAAT